MFKKTILAAASALSLVVSAGVANATVIEFSSLTASWLNVNPTSGVSVTGNGTTSPSLRWGSPATAAGQSGYDFVAEPTPLSVVLPPSPSANFNLGTFTHLNQPIYAPTLTSATLRLDAVINVDGNLVGTRSFLFDFTHDETANIASDCPADSIACDDIVTATVATLSESFSVDGQFYTLNIAGFMSGGSLVNEFHTVEGQNNTATIVASLAAVSIAEPATLGLFGLGLAGLGFVNRRRRMR